MSDEEKIINIVETISSQLLQLKLNGLNDIKESELSSIHFQYISVLDKLGEATFTELSEELKISKPAITAFINKFLKQKIVSKTQSDKDKRVYYIKLTDKGRQIADVYNNTLLTFAKKLKGSMTKEEFKQLVYLLEKGM